MPLDGTLHVERTRLGFKFSNGSESSTIVFQGFIHKKKIVAYLATLGIDSQ
ncbi:MAG: hypothetical protein R3C10_24255 [Pirellulales bacterium]